MLTFFKLVQTFSQHNIMRSYVKDPNYLCLSLKREHEINIHASHRKLNHANRNLLIGINVNNSNEGKLPLMSTRYSQKFSFNETLIRLLYFLNTRKQGYALLAFLKAMIY